MYHILLNMFTGVFVAVNVYLRTLRGGRSLSVLPIYACFLTHEVASASPFLDVASCSSHRTSPPESIVLPAPPAAADPPGPTSSPLAAAEVASLDHRCSSPAIDADRSAPSLLLESGTMSVTFACLEAENGVIGGTTTKYRSVAFFLSVCKRNCRR